MNFLHLVAAAVMWCQSIILINGQQSHSVAKGAMLEISKPERMPISSITWMCTLLNRCITI